jgi:hypothetical protein
MIISEGFYNIKIFLKNLFRFLIINNCDKKSNIIQIKHNLLENIIIKKVNIILIFKIVTRIVIKVAQPPLLLLQILKNYALGGVKI